MSLLSRGELKALGLEPEAFVKAKSGKSSEGKPDGKVRKRDTVNKTPTKAEQKAKDA